MDKKRLETPVLFLIFNRLDTATQVFESIREARPLRLYIAGDGPRTEHQGESDEVLTIREYVLSMIDWDCDVKTLFRAENLGCKLAVSSAIGWFFEHEEMGIILEDDILPGQSFFRFCEELLIRYKDDERVMHIAGMTYVEDPVELEGYSYHFARVGGIWGWGTWRRAWKLYESEMESYPQALEEKVFDDLFIGEEKIKGFYLQMFKRGFKNTHTWDYQWTYTKIINGSINIMPSRNLVKNIGLGVKGATHTNKSNAKFETMSIKELDFPLRHPKFKIVDTKFNTSNLEYVLSS